MRCLDSGVANNSLPILQLSRWVRSNKKSDEHEPPTFDFVGELINIGPPPQYLQVQKYIF